MSKKEIYEYTILCTEEQVKKAIKLGAKIKYEEVTDIEGHLLDYDIIKTPTSEQMIGWLEDQDIIREVNVYRSANYEGWYYSILGSNKQYITINDHPIASIGKYDTRKESTLTAIDTALDYLIKKK